MQKGIQDRVLVLAASKFESKKDFVRFLVDELHLGESAVYNRLSGKTQFTVNELEHIIDRLDIGLLLFNNYDPGDLMVRYDAMSKFKNDPVKYLQDINDILSYMDQFADFEINGFFDSLSPISILKLRHLGSLRIYHWLTSNSNLGTVQNFGNILHDEQLSSLLKNIIEIYDRRTTIDIYQGDIYNKTLNMVDYYRKVLAFDPYFDLEKIHEELISSIRLLKNRCDNPKEGYEMYFTSLYIVPNTLQLFADGKTRNFISFSEPFFMTIDMPIFSNYMEDHRKNVLEHSSQLSGRNRVLRDHYFDVSMKKVNKYFSRIKNI